MDENRYIQLDVACYNSALQVLGNQSADDAMPFCRLGLPVSPSPVSYQILVEICRNCNDYLMDLFEDCIERRMLDDILIKAFREYGPDLVVEQL